MTAPLDEAAFAALRRGRFGAPYLYAERTETTQALLGPLHPEGAVALAEEQTAGRGRRGRSWEAPAGSSILVSILLRPPTERRPAELTLVAGAAVAAALERAAGLPARLKWPNDVVVEGHKVAGGLAELRDGAVVLGIGVNVGQAEAELPAVTKLPAGSLRSVAGRPFERGPILADLLVELERRYDAWCANGLAAVLGELAERDFLRGRRVVVDGVEGTARGIDERGRLLVESGAGTTAVESGEVLLS